MTTPTLDILIDDEDTKDALEDAGLADRTEDAAGEITGGAGTISPEPVVNVSQGTEHQTIGDAVGDANEDDIIEVKSGTYEESVEIDVEGLTLEGPNAGIAGDSGERGDEATITSGVFVDGNPSDVVIDGLAIERTIGEAEGVVQIGSTSNPGANNLTIRNNVITATSNGPSNLGTILIEQIDGEIQIEDNLLTQTGDGTGSAQVRGLVEAVQLANTTIVVDGNTIETDFGVRPSGFDGPSPEYTITNNEFVENDGVGVQLGGDYSGKVEISGNTFEDSNIGIDHATGATTDITIESNTFTETAGADIVAFVSDRRGGDGSVVGLDRDAIEANNTFNPGSKQVGPIDFAGEKLFEIVPDDS